MGARDAGSGDRHQYMAARKIRKQIKNTTRVRLQNAPNISIAVSLCLHVCIVCVACFRKHVAVVKLGISLCTPAVRSQRSCVVYVRVCVHVLTRRRV